MARLGDAEQQARYELIRRGGVWRPEDPPLWDNRYWTERLLYSLVKKGKVSVLKDGSFVLNRD